MPKYNIYFRKYNIIARDYVQYIKVVETHDIYHEIGKLICQSIERIENIGYTLPATSLEECEKYWIERGYEKVANNLWAKFKNDNE